jgi:hypothetical protein
MKSSRPTTGNRVYRKAWDGFVWKPAPTNWQPLGVSFNILMIRTIQIYWQMV